MIKVLNLNKYYNKGKTNEIHVINNTTIELPDKGLVALFGPSGSGKTTLLNVIGGLDKASGTISYPDQTFQKYQMNKIDEYRRNNIGYVFQNYKLLLNETVYDNLKIALEIIGITDLNEVDRRIEYTLNAVNMFKFRKKKAYALSGGQQQRVSIARALLKNSKIIIADEPTGNLDSENTLEVMNILKQISQNTLVLLVTHNANIANYYSDLVLEIKDGQIGTIRKLDGTEKFKKDLDNTFYLKDAKKQEVQTDFGTINIYREGDNAIQLNIYIKNGTLYCQSSQPIKIAEKENIKIVDEHYHEDYHPSVNYDTSWYDDSSIKGQRFKHFFNYIKNAWYRFISVTRKKVFLYIALFLIGAVMAFSASCLVTATSIDVSDVAYNNHYSSLINYDNTTGSYVISKEAYQSDAITNITHYIEADLSYSEYVSYHENIKVEKKVSILPYVEGHMELSLGRIPTDENDNQEIVINHLLADQIIDQYTNPIPRESLLGKQIHVVVSSIGTTFTIVGISTNDQHMNYVSHRSHQLLSYNFIHNNSITLRNYKQEVDQNGNRLYKVVEGKDIDPEKTDIPQALEKYEKQQSTADMPAISKQYPYYARINKTDYLVVGSYEHQFEIKNDTYITNQPSLGGSFLKHGSFSSTDYAVVEGRDIASKYEVIVPYNYIIELNEKIGDYTVVGKFSGSSLSMNYMILLSASASIERFSSQLLFNVQDEEALDRIVSNYGFDYDSNLKAQALLLKEISQKNLILFESLFLVLLIISLVFIYFIMRSKMISEIYTIGVYRSLGVSKNSSYKKYFLDGLYLTLFTSMIGFIITSYVCQYIESILYPVQMYNILFGSIYYYLLGGVVLFLSMLLFSFLPIWRVLKKTPIEITMKYDI